MFDLNKLAASCFAVVALCAIWGCESAPQPVPTLVTSDTADSQISGNDADAGITGTDAASPDAQADSSTDVAQTQPDIQAPAPCGGTCDDGNICTTDICAADGKCVHVNVIVPCSDGNACSVNDSCNNVGICAGVTATCDDGDACTTDTCNPASGCAFTGKACDDGDPCTDDTCDKAKGCVSTLKTCDDGESCTKDICGAGGVCAHVATVGNCDDNNACTVNDVCTAAGTCAGTLKSCDDQNPCTDDFCLAGACVHGINSAACDDNNACTEKDSCKAGTCAGTPKTCDDGDLCTIDACDKVKGCSYPEVKCDDAITNPYNAGCTTDTCNQKTGVCEHLPVDCDDGKVWTYDYCSSQSSDTYKCVSYDKYKACNDSSQCVDGDVCTENFCSLDGTCDWVPMDCDDNNPCTLDTCKSSGCVNTPKVCNDNNSATIDACNQKDGACTFTPVPPQPIPVCPASCDDSNPATVDSCLNGQCYHTTNTGLPAACNPWGAFVYIPGTKQQSNWKFGIDLTGANPIEVDVSVQEGQWWGNVLAHSTWVWAAPWGTPLPAGTVCKDHCGVVFPIKLINSYVGVCSTDQK